MSTTKRITGETKTVVGWPSHHWVNPRYGFSKSCKYFRDINNSFCKMLNFAWGNISLLCALGKSGNTGPRNEQALTSHQLCGVWAMTSSLRCWVTGSRWPSRLVCEYSQHRWNVHGASSPRYLGQLLSSHPLSRGLWGVLSPWVLPASCSASEAMLRSLVWSWLLLKDKSLW